MAKKNITGSGGTEGGIGEFFIGLIMFVAGGYLLLNQVIVTSGGWGHFFSFGSFSASFGVALIPFLFGIGFLFFDSKSIPGWLLSISGAVIIFAGILNSMRIYFKPTSLFNTLVMLVLLVGGIGLFLKSFRKS